MVTSGYKGLQAVTGGYRGYKGLQGVARDYKGLQEVRLGIVIFRYFCAKAVLCNGSAY